MITGPLYEPVYKDGSWKIYPSSIGYYISHRCENGIGSVSRDICLSCYKAAPEYLITMVRLINL